MVLKLNTIHPRIRDSRDHNSYIRAFNGTWRFIITFTRALHLYLSWARPIQSTPPHPSSPRSTYLCLGLPSGLFPSGFPTNNLYTVLFSPIHTTWPAHLITPELINLIILGKEYKSCSSLSCSFLHLSITSSLFGPNILLSTLFSHTLSLWSFLNVRDQVLQPYRTTRKIIVL
jgi:hypothetical protein